MFKRKSNLPPRPQIPSTNQILEDLTAAADDVEFLDTAKTINSKTSKSDESQVQDPSYQNIKNFLQQNQDLLKTMEELKATYKNIQACSTELTILSEDLKEQAVKALL